MKYIVKYMKPIFSSALIMTTGFLYGQNPPVEQSQKGFAIDNNTLLIILALFLLIPVWVLSRTFMASARQFYLEDKKAGGMKVMLMLLIVMMSSTLFAQQSQYPILSGLKSNALTILLLCVIAAELLLILFFASKSNDFMQKAMHKSISPARSKDPLTWLREKWKAMNFRQSIDEEHKIDTGHSYDGIRELDNVIPPWFTTAFIITILFAIVYVYRYHIAKSAPMQIQEYENAVALAELEHDTYLKSEASNIDESNVVVLTGADLDAGKKTFVSLCAACHKADGGGMVGPNLTDDYWIHGGSLQDVFKTVKYGYPEKGMISWKEQLSPIQMAQVSNYILTLKGTNPPDAKEKQGELYTPAEGVKDTSTVQEAKTDSLAIKVE